jgi:hypothetical protein
LAVDRDRALDDNRGFLDVGLAAAVEVLALLLREEEAPEILLGGDLPRRGSEQKCHREKASRKFHVRSDG